MAPPTFNFNMFMEKEKLANNRSNFTNWALNLRILLTACKKLYVLDAPLGDQPANDASEEDKNVYLTQQEDHSIVHCGILYGLEPELQKMFREQHCLCYNGRIEIDFRYPCCSREL